MYAGVNEKPLLYLSNVLHEYSIIPEVWMFASTAEIFFDFHPSMQLLPCESFHKNFTENVFNLLKCIQQLKYNDTLSFMLSWELTEMGKMHFKGTWKTHWGGGGSVLIWSNMIKNKLRFINDFKFFWVLGSHSPHDPLKIILRYVYQFVSAKLCFVSSPYLIVFPNLCSFMLING